MAKKMTDESLEKMIESLNTFQKNNHNGITLPEQSSVLIALLLRGILQELREMNPHG